jgi:arylsulfatase A-like enzyme
MIKRLTVLLGLAAIASGYGGCASPRKPPHNGLNVLLVVMDTARADRFSCYGNPRNVTPAIDLIAARGVRFENCLSNSSWTLPSHASMFTGQYSVGHRATQETLVMSEKPVTLAEIFTGSGYQTFGTSMNGVVSVDNGLARGFDEFFEAFKLTSRRETTREKVGFNNRAFERFLTKADRARPFFAFFNYIAPHLPYAPPDPPRSRFVAGSFNEGEIQAAMQVRMPDHYMYRTIDGRQFDLLGQLYEAEINIVDRAIGNLFAILQQNGLLDQTAVVVVSDHGENLGDHGHFDHVFSIHNTLLRVPLIVALPGGARGGTVRRDTAQLIDLFPTILSMCGISYQGRMDGRDLFAEGAESVDVFAMAEYYYPRQVLSVFDPEELVASEEKFRPFMKRHRAIQNGELKLVWGSDGSRELYRIGDDPGETRDLLRERPDHPAADEMIARLELMVKSHQGEDPLPPAPPPGWMVPGFEDRIKDPELLKKLRSLGYVK